jgi:hypothetical protein
VSLCGTHAGGAGGHAVVSAAGGAEEEARRQRAQVPKDVAFATKAARALALLDEATRCGVKPEGVTGEAD